MKRNRRVRRFLGRRIPRISLSGCIRSTLSAVAVTALAVITLVLIFGASGCAVLEGAAQGNGWGGTSASLPIFTASTPGVSMTSALPAENILYATRPNWCQGAVKEFALGDRPQKVTVIGVGPMLVEGQTDMVPSNRVARVLYACMPSLGWVSGTSTIYVVVNGVAVPSHCEPQRFDAQAGAVIGLPSCQ